MSYTRFSLDLAIKNPLSPALVAKIPAIKDAVRQLKVLAEKINAGQPGEENTVRATYHICKHDEGLPCEPEIEI